MRARLPASAMACSHLNAMSFIQPRTLRSAVLASRTSCCLRSPNVPAGSSSRRSSRPMRPVTSWRVARKDDAVTSASKIVNSVAEWVSSRHVRRPNRNRFAYQSSGSGAGAGSATAEPRTFRSFLVHRRITVRSYDVEPRAAGPVLSLPVLRLRTLASRPVRNNPNLYLPNEPAACPSDPARPPGQARHPGGTPIQERCPPRHPAGHSSGGRSRSSRPIGVVRAVILPSLVDVFQQDPLVEAAPLSALATHLRHDLLPAHVMSRGESLQYLQHVG